MITLLIVLLVLAALFCIVWTVHRQDELDEREYELEQISLDLDGRANRIAAEEENIKNEWQYLRMAKEMLDKHEVSLQESEEREDFLSLSEMQDKESVEVTSGYLVTESDEMKYARDSAVFAAVRNKIALNIAYDLIHKFPDPDVEYVGPRKKYTYRFRVSRLGEDSEKPTLS